MACFYATSDKIPYSFEQPLFLANTSEPDPSSKSEVSEDPALKLVFAYNKLVERLETGEMNPELRRDYRDTWLKLLQVQFDSPSAIPDEKWRAVSSVLYEAEPQGCSHVYFGTALLLSIRKEMNAEEADSRISSVNELLKRLDSLLQNYLAIAITISSIRFCTKKDLDFEATIRQMLIEDNLVQIETIPELLFPIGYLSPTTNEGHLLLCRARKNGITLFNALPTVRDKSVGSCILNGKIAKIFQIHTSFEIQNNRDIDQILDNVFPVLPRQLAVYMQKIGVDDRDMKKFHVEQIDTIYRQVLQNGTPKRPSEFSLFSYVQYIEGNVCVPMAFRMLLLSVAKEEVDKAQLPLQQQQEAKTWCDDFWEGFKAIIKSKFG